MNDIKLRRRSLAGRIVRFPRLAGWLWRVNPQASARDRISIIWLAWRSITRHYGR